jgi:transposase
VTGFSAPTGSRYPQVAVTRSGLPEIHGLGTISAAKIIGIVGDIDRFPSSGHFASYTGTAPLDASSRQRVRHRLNTGGNRRDLAHHRGLPGS